MAWLESFPPFGEGDGLDDDEYLDQDRGVFYGPSDTDDFDLWLDRRRQLQPGPLVGLDGRRFSELLLEGPARYRALYGDVESLLWASGMDPGDAEAEVWFGDGRDFADHYLVGGVVDCEVLDMLGYDSVSMAVAGMGAHADTYTGTTVGHTPPGHVHQDHCLGDPLLLHANRPRPTPLTLILSRRRRPVVGSRKGSCAAPRVASGRCLAFSVRRPSMAYWHAGLR